MPQWPARLQWEETAFSAFAVKYRKSYNCLLSGVKMMLPLFSNMKKAVILVAIPRAPIYKQYTVARPRVHTGPFLSTGLGNGPVCTYSMCGQCVRTVCVASVYVQYVWPDQCVHCTVCVACQCVPILGAA